MVRVGPQRHSGGGEGGIIYLSAEQPGLPGAKRAQAQEYD